MSMWTSVQDFGGRRFVPIAIAIIVLLAVGVFKAKTDAAATRKRVAEMEASVAASQQEARGLAAEVQYLENPKRIEALSRRELKMAPATRDQKKSLDDLKPANGARP